MNFDHIHYVPCLRWKQGEYQATVELSRKQKAKLTPLIEVPEKGWDFEQKTDKKTVDQLLKPFAKRVHDKWGKTDCFIDFNHLDPSERMPDGSAPVAFAFRELRRRRCQAIPVTGINREAAYQSAIKVIVKHSSDICLRISIEEAAQASVTSEIDLLLSDLGIQHSNCHLILDLGAPSFELVAKFSNVIQSIISRLPYLGEWLTFTLLGTSFPSTMGGIKKGGVIIPRLEWQLYKNLIADLKRADLRLPTFGDYTIVHPNIVEVDMRIVKPSAKVRYTIDNSWYIAKGNSVRDRKSRSQYRKLCRQIIESKHYCGPEFSWGSNYIQKCADGTGSTGNLTTWVKVGTNHHLEKVVQDVANFYGSLDNP